MMEFAYNNAKNLSTSYKFFKFNCVYHLYVFFEDNVDSHSKFYSVKELVRKLRELISIYQ